MPISSQVTLTGTTGNMIIQVNCAWHIQRYRSDRSRLTFRHRLRPLFSSALPPPSLSTLSSLPTFAFPSSRCRRQIDRLVVGAAVAGGRARWGLGFPWGEGLGIHPWLGPRDASASRPPPPSAPRPSRRTRSTTVSSPPPPPAGFASFAGVGELPWCGVRVSTRRGGIVGGFQSVVLLLGFFLLVCVLANFGEFCAV